MRDLPHIKEIVLLVFVDLVLLCVEVPRELKDPSCDLFDSVPADHIVQKRAQYISPDLLGCKVNVLLFVIDLLPLRADRCIGPSPQIQERLQVMNHHEIQHLIDQVEIILSKCLSIRDHHLLGKNIPKSYIFVVQVLLQVHDVKLRVGPAQFVKASHVNAPAPDLFIGCGV